MHQTSAGTWTSGPIPLVFSGRIGDILFIRFRIASSNNQTSSSDTSRVYSFNIQGRPDLMFIGDTLRPSWYGDSLRVHFQVLNAGNKAAPPYQTVLYWGVSGGNAFRILQGADSLLPGKTMNFIVGIPDTQGIASITAVINPNRSFPEISFDNNRAAIVFRLGYADLLKPTDSLFSPGKGLCINAPNGFAGKRRVFLFTSHALPVRPLVTESSWAPLMGDSSAQFSLGVRPALSGSDSLAWIFTVDTVLSRAAAVSPTGKASVMTFDSSMGAWRFAWGNFGTSQRTLTMHSQLMGPFSVGLLSDVKPPEIRASVNGREIIFLDYAAKGKPFNIHVSDASGIAPSSIRVRLNNSALDSGSVSRSINQTGLGDMTITAYPPKEQSVDSLSVYAQDCAGNGATAVFAYMPGEDLQIKFFSCHPNPFTAAQDARGSTMQTIRFAFLLTDVARDVSITVYAIGGRVIWKWQKSGGTIGYQEVEWDGKTNTGHRIANGTYYAKLIAINDSKKIYKNIRIAKLEGY
jgi:hypothetical protein